MRAALLLSLLSTVAFAGESTCSVMLTDAGAQKIAIIKIVREHTGLDLKTAKDLVEAPKPKLIRDGLTPTQANALVDALTEKGAIAEIYQGGQRISGHPRAATPREPTFDVRLESWGTNKIEVIKIVRAQTGLMLGETKTLVESAPVVVVTGLSRPLSESVLKQLTDAGAKATLIPTPTR